MDVYVCRDDFQSILSGIYDAGTSGKRSRDQRLELEGEREPELFCRYLEVVSERRKAESVMTAVREKLSGEAGILLWEVSLSGQKGKADHMYRFLVDGFRHGPGIVHMLSLDSVFRMYEMQRYVRNEAHLLTGLSGLPGCRRGFWPGGSARKTMFSPWWQSILRIGCPGRTGCCGMSCGTRLPSTGQTGTR